MRLITAFHLLRDCVRRIWRYRHVVADWLTVVGPDGWMTLPGSQTKWLSWDLLHLSTH